MKKRLLLIGLVSLVGLSSCGVSSKTPTSKATKYEHISLDRSEDELKNAIEQVDGANVVFCSYISNFFVSNYSFQSAVIYKHVGTTYYALTYFDNTMFTTGLSYAILPNGVESYQASLYRYDSTNKLAIIAFKTSNELPVAQIKSESPKAGEMVFSVASEKKSGLTSFNDYDFDQHMGRVFSGIISRDGIRRCTHTAMSSVSDYGSGLFDYDGNLVGINVEKESSSQTTSYILDLNYAIYGSALNSIVSDMESSTSSSISRKSLPISADIKYSEIEDDFPSDINVAIYVKKDSSGKLKTGDYIASLDGYIMYNVEVYEDVLYKTLASKSLTAVVYRKNGSKYDRLEILV